MTKADVERLADATREELLAPPHGLSAEQADALLALEPGARRRILVEAWWDAGGGKSAAASVLHAARRPPQTTAVDSVTRMRRKYPYTAFGLMGTPAARDCPHATVTKGKTCPRKVRVPVVVDRRHESELMARHGLERE